MIMPIHQIDKNFMMDVTKESLDAVIEAIRYIVSESYDEYDWVAEGIIQDLLAAMEV